jgi:hypothetical protein
MIRKDFYANLNGILDSCGWDMLGGKKRRPFLAYSWKKYYCKNSLSLADISHFREIRNVLLKHNKCGSYLMLMHHRMVVNN